MEEGGSGEGGREGGGKREGVEEEGREWRREGGSGGGREGGREWRREGGSGGGREEGEREGETGSRERRERKGRKVHIRESHSYSYISLSTDGGWLCVRYYLAMMATSHGENSPLKQRMMHHSHQPNTHHK